MNQTDEPIVLGRKRRNITEIRRAWCYVPNGHLGGAYFALTRRESREQLGIKMQGGERPIRSPSPLAGGPAVQKALDGGGSMYLLRAPENNHLVMNRKKNSGRGTLREAEANMEGGLERQDRANA